MSNRGRQNVASFLAKHQGLDWRWGAQWFEHHLIDYDPCVNWGNWQYVAGIGTDLRDRMFNIRRQAEIYDGSGIFVRRWLPGTCPSGHRRTDCDERFKGEVWRTRKSAKGPVVRHENRERMTP